jgi:catechol 2,3-dioxygenase-like lactoylglutathione lyase family enzyme
MTAGSSSLMPIEPSPRRAPVPPRRADEVDGPRLSTAVMFVHDLDASVNFYSEVLHMTVTVREPAAALLVSVASFQLYLRQMGSRTPHPLGAIGVQYVIWTASSTDDLDRCERAMKEAGRRPVTRHVVDGITFIEGKDPSGVPVVITHPGPDRTARRAIMQRVYSW